MGRDTRIGRNMSTISNIYREEHWINKFGFNADIDIGTEEYGHAEVNGYPLLRQEYIS